MLSKYIYPCHSVSKGQQGIYSTFFHHFFSLTNNAAYSDDELIPRHPVLLDFDFKTGEIVFHEDARDAMRAVLVVNGSPLFRHRVLKRIQLRAGRGNGRGNH